MKKTKNEIIKGLQLGKDALDKTQSQQEQIEYCKKKIKEAIEYLDTKRE